MADNASYLRCELCITTMTCMESYQQHMEGKKHAKSLKFKEITKSASTRDSGGKITTFNTINLKHSNCYNSHY